MLYRTDAVAAAQQLQGRWAAKLDVDATPAERYSAAIALAAGLLLAASRIGVQPEPARDALNIAIDGATRVALDVLLGRLPDRALPIVGAIAGRAAG